MGAIIFRFGYWSGDLLPTYFALVMATGIISIAGFLSGWEVIGYGLFYLNLLFLVLLFLAFGYRCATYGERVLDDLRSYQKGPGFFTIVACREWGLYDNGPIPEGEDDVQIPEPCIFLLKVETTYRASPARILPLYIFCIG